MSPMTPAGALPWSELATLLAAFGGATVVLYLLKLRRRRVEVPFVPLWDDAVEPQRLSALVKLYRRLKRLGSLLVQLTLLGLVVLALGSPHLAGEGGAGGARTWLAGCGVHAQAPPPPPRHTVVLLDASASMQALEGGQRRAARAKVAARRAVEALVVEPSQHIMLVQVSAHARPLTPWTRDLRVLRAALDAYTPRDTPTHMAQALAPGGLVASALRGRPNPEVLLVSDRAFPPLPPERVEALHLRVIPLSGDDEAAARAAAPANESRRQAGRAAPVNLSMEAFNVRPYLDDSLTYAVYYAVRNTSDRPLRATLHLYAREDGRGRADFEQGGALVSSFALTVPAHGRTRDVVGDVSFPGSRLMARVVLAPDEPARDVLAADDVAFAVVPPRRRVRVLLVSEGNLFLQASLLVRENVSFDVRTPAAYRADVEARGDAARAGYDVVIVDAADVPLDAPGGYLLLGPPAAPGAGAWPPGTRVLGAVEEPRVGRVDRHHPLARDLVLDGLDIQRAVAVKPAPGDRVVVATRGGRPLLYTHREGEGARARRFAVLTFDVRQSLLPLRTSFPLLVVNALSWFVAERDALLYPVATGADASVAWDDGGPSARPPLALRGPGGVEAEGVRLLAGRLRFRADWSGVYEPVAARGSAANARPPARAVAVNLADPAEGAVRPRGDYPVWEAPRPAAAGRASEGGGGSAGLAGWLTPPWRVLVLGALLLALGEWFTYHRRWTV